MSIDWSALGQVAGVSIGATVAVAVVFALGVRVLSGPGPAGEPLAGEAEPGMESGTARGAGGAIAVSAPARRPPVALFVAGLCFLACLAAVAYGLYLIVPQFH
jgi:hypothetical protein